MKKAKYFTTSPWNVVFFFLLLFTVRVQAQVNSPVDSIKKCFVFGQYAKAVQLADSLLKTDSSNTEVMWLAGKAMMEMYEYQNSETVLKKALLIDPHSIKTLKSLFQVAQMQGKYKLATACCDSILALDSSDYETHVNYGLLSLRTGKYDKALEMFQALFQADSSNAFVNKQIGLIYYNIGNNDQAAYYFEKSLASNPEDITLLQNLVNVSLNRKSYEMGMKYCDLGVQADSANLFFIRNKAYLYFLEQNLDESYAWFSTVLAMGDSTPFTCKYAGITFHKLEMHGKAVPLLEKALLSEPDNIKLIYMLGMSYQRLYDYDMALQKFQEGFMFQVPDSILLSVYFNQIAETYRLKGIMAFNRKKYDEANQNYSKAMENFLRAMACNPEDKRILLQMAILQETQLKNLKQAMAYLIEFSISFQPKNKADSLTLNYSLQKIGKLKEELHFLAE